MPAYSALFDGSTTALLALSIYPNIISFLAKSSSLEAEQAHAVNWPNYRQNFTLVEQDPKTFPTWAWDIETRRFSLTPKHLVTAELRRRSDLAMKKAGALAEVSYELSVARYPVYRGVLLQEVVYAAKKEQAQRYNDLGHQEADLLQYPYVMQYAEFAGLTPQAAADEILFKAKLDDDVLLTTELMRLKYFNAIEAAPMERLDLILKQFRLEIYKRPT